MNNIVELRPRPRGPAPYPQSAEGIEVVGYEFCALHEGVPITLLVGALARAGLTCSNLKGHGLVIHRIGQDPARPAPVLPGAS